MNPGLLTTLGVIFAAICGYLGVRVTAQQNRKAKQAELIAQDKRDRDAREAKEAVDRRDGLVQLADRLTAEIGRLTERVRALESREDAQRAALLHHSAWDYTAVQALREAGMALPDPPPLMPPRASDT